MAKITDYPKVAELTQNNVLLLDGENGTKGILASDLGNALLSLMTTKEIMNNVNIADLDATSSVEADSSLLVSTSSGNKKISMSDAVYAILDPVIPVETRRNLWRGKNLGSVVTDTQYDQIGAGTFKGLFLGDYWEIGGRIWRIVDFDYWLGCGDRACNDHHLVIMPDDGFYKSVMNDSNVTTGGYMGSKMYTTNLEEAKTIVNGVFGEIHILNHREELTNAVINGYPSGVVWVDSTVELPNEIMIYGSYIYHPAGDGSISVFRQTIDATQLAGMKAFRKLISPKRYNYWLRDIGNNTNFVAVQAYGDVRINGASNDFYVRPVFGLKK